MKTIFRYTNIAALTAAFIVVGAVASFAQDPCADAEGQTTLGDKFRTQYADKTIDGRKAAIDTGKQFQEKYGACPSAAELADYLKVQIPKMEEALKKLVDAKAEADLTTPFDAALKAKNWDDVFKYGKQILDKYPEKYRTVEIVLASVGGEEALKSNNKYIDDTLVYAKQSIADLEAGKSFTLTIDGKPKTVYGLSLLDANKKAIYNFEYPNKDDAIGWLSFYTGYVLNIAKKDKAGSLPYLYKATQATSETKNKPVPYGLIGYYYVAEGDKLADEITALSKTQDPKDTEEIAKQKVDAIKAKVALSNGTNERAIDAFSRALARTSATDAAYKADIKKALDFSYNRRFGKMEGLDAWVANTQKQPFVNPTTPVTPVSDPEPTAASTTTTMKTPPPAKTEAAPAKPTTTTPAKPAAAPAAKTSKPQAKMKKTVAKKIGA